MLESMPKRSQGLPDNYEELEHQLAREIGMRLRQRRVELQISQEAMRARLELHGVFVSRTQFSRLEQGNSQLKAIEVVALANVLERSCDWILLGIEPSVK